MAIEVKDLKTSQLKKKKKGITEMQNQLIVITKMEEAEDWIGDIEDKMMENNEDEKKREWKLSDH